MQPSYISLTKDAAARWGITLTDAEAEKHAAVIERQMAGQEDGYGQDFWDAAKEYFLP